MVRFNEVRCSSKSVAQPSELHTVSKSYLHSDPKYKLLLMVGRGQGGAGAISVSRRNK